MADQIVITEKTSQAKDVRAAVGSRYGDILPAVLLQTLPLADFP
jgi:DNA topoisomerase-3